MANKLEIYNGTDWLTVSTGDVTGTANEITITASGNNHQVALAANPVIPGTGAMTIPTGTALQYPTTPTLGMMRFTTGA